MRRMLPALLCLALPGCVAVAAHAVMPHREAKAQPANPVVGSWLVNQPAAAFAWQLYSFHADGTVDQASPDGSTGGKGAWRPESDAVVGRRVELRADRATHAYAGRGELSFRLTVTGDRLAGTARFTATDAAGTAAPPLDMPFTGTRIVP